MFIDVAGIIVALQVQRPPVGFPPGSPIIFHLPKTSARWTDNAKLPSQVYRSMQMCVHGTQWWTGHKWQIPQIPSPAEGFPDLPKPTMRQTCQHLQFSCSIYSFSPVASVIFMTNFCLVFGISSEFPLTMKQLLMMNEWMKECTVFDEIFTVNENCALD